MEIISVIIDALRHSILITGLVIVMMMMIESLNIESRGLIFKGLQKTRLGQILFASALGSIPGCMGGFAVVSLYTHRLLSFGALVAMMIASSGDEAFVMLAMVPEDAMILFAILFCIAAVTGYLVDLIHPKIKKRHDIVGGIKDDVGYVVHQDEDDEISSGDENDGHMKHQHHKKITWGWKRIVLLGGILIFILALVLGITGHGHSGTENHHALDNLMNEDWMHVIFGMMSAVLLIVLCFSSDHFINEHIWHHVIKKHLPSIFAWTFGVLIFIGIGLKYIDIEAWISDNAALMIILATLIGLIPESGPHMIFVTLYATGMVPFSVLLASSISQDGHASLPLIAESKRGYLWAKIINCLVAAGAGLICMLIIE